jgi:hypothetical protein
MRRKWLTPLRVKNLKRSLAEESEEMKKLGRGKR